MGFWHTGYMDFHEATSEANYEHHYVPPPPEYPCTRCKSVFASRDDLAVHLFDGHVASRPSLVLQGRECGRSRLSVIARTRPDDWTFRNATAIRVNGRSCSSSQACKFLASTSTGVVKVALEGSTADQDFEFDFSIADDVDLDGVDAGLYALIDGRSLTINSIEAYLRSTTSFASARRYRDSIANYLYGVLARENSPESGLVDIASSSPRYTERFDDAVAELGRYERPPAEAISGLVAFHYNQFDLALRKTRSPRVARIAMRFACLLRGFAHTDSEELDLDQDSLDYTLSDTETERVLVWTSIPLDGTATARVVEIEDAIPWATPADAMKLRMIAAEHHLVAGDAARGLAHVSALRHTRALEKWSEWYRERAVGPSR